MKDKNIIACGSCKYIQNIAQNKVYILPENVKADINGKYIFQKQFESDGVKMIKILSNSPQSFYSVVPNVEDGYICMLKNV
jgi:hypothetical protein